MSIQCIGAMPIGFIKKVKLPAIKIAPEARFSWLKDYYEYTREINLVRKVKATPCTREAIADMLHAEFFKLVDDVFEKKGHVTIKEIREFIKKLIPNVNIEIVEAKGGALKCKYNDEIKTVEGYDLEILFTRDKVIEKNDSVSNKILAHEVKHLFKSITDPKYICHINTGKLSPETNSLQSSFYVDVLYNNELNYFKQTVLNNTQRSKFIKTIIKDFLKGFSLEEQIIFLTRWRYGLKDEKEASKAGIDSYIQHKFNFKNLSKRLKNGKDIHPIYYITGSEKISFDSKLYKTIEEKINKLEEFIKNAQKLEQNEDDKNWFFFSEKIKIMEEMLAEKIQTARAKPRKFHPRKNVQIEQNQNLGFSFDFVA